MGHSIRAKQVVEPDLGFGGALAIMRGTSAGVENLYGGFPGTNGIGFPGD